MDQFIHSHTFTFKCKTHDRVCVCSYCKKYSKAPHHFLCILLIWPLRRCGALNFFSQWGQTLTLPCVCEWTYKSLFRLYVLSQVLHLNAKVCEWLITWSHKHHLCQKRLLQTQHENFGNSCSFLCWANAPLVLYCLWQFCTVHW